MNDIEDVKNKFKNCNTLSDISMKDLLDADDGYAHIVAKNIIKNSNEKNKVNTTQLRKFFSALKTMEQKNTWEEIEAEFYLLKPRMAVSVGRGNLSKLFYRMIISAMSKVDNVESDDEKMKNFDKFVKFFEAIVAYHKYEALNSKR